MITKIQAAEDSQTTLRVLSDFSQTSLRLLSDYSQTTLRLLIDYTQKPSDHTTGWPHSNVFLNDAIQNCHSYLIFMSKLKSFEFSSKWRQERIFYSMRLVSMFQQTKTCKSYSEFSNSRQPVFIPMPFLNEKS